MKRSIFLMLAFALASPAMAADLPPYAAKAPISAAYNWSGFYAGAHGGYGWGQTQDVSNAGAAERKTKGGFGGVQAGYNWQANGSPFVLGIEADASFGAISNSWGGANQFDSYYGRDTISTFGTVRGRLGYAFDRVLVYGTGGLAWGIEDHGFGCDAARVTVTNGCQNRVGGKSFYTSGNATNIGWTAGGGVEIGVTRNWSVKGEYLFTDFGQNAMTLVDPNYPAKSGRNFDTTFHSVRAGINYRF